MDGLLRFLIAVLDRQSVFRYADSMAG
jgi:hypothetical protein